LRTADVKRVTFEIRALDVAGVMYDMLDQFLQYQRDRLAMNQGSQVEVSDQHRLGSDGA